MALETLKNGRYRVLRLIGRGSMGEVYLVEDTFTHRQEALKVIRADASSQTQESTQFFEAKTIAELHHPHILPLLDYGVEAINGSLLPYVVMPLCSEGSLAAWLQQHENISTLSLQDVAQFVGQGADGLQYAHEHGVIHRNVKPSNFLIRRRTYDLPELILGDFGSANLLSGTLSAGQPVRGTPTYIAPKQWEGHPAPASDQYALAVMIYQLLTGRPSFQGDPEQLLYKHINIWPAAPSTINPTLSQGIDTVLLRALAKKPGDRFATISAFASAFQHAIQPLAAPTMIGLIVRPS